MGHEETTSGSSAGGDFDFCSLPSEELQIRFRMIREHILPHVRRTEELDNGFAWECDHSPEMREKLARLVEMERQCCSGLDFDLQEPAGSNVLRLEVHGIDPRSKALDALRGPGRRDAANDGGMLARAAKAGGIGVAGAFLVFCGLPIAVAAIAGAAVAAPLAGLESPFALAGGSLVFGCAAWMLQRRRHGPAGLVHGWRRRCVSGREYLLHHAS